MCTVTYLPLDNDNFILTSSRDVSPNRKVADFPREFKTKNGKICFPKDGEAGGTWIGTNETGRTVVILNGAFESHKMSPPYRKSRGLVVRDILEANDFWDCIQHYNFNGVEPFTLLILDWFDLFEFWELIWDGERKYLKQLDTAIPIIYSSSTLYDETMRQKRQKWFDGWLEKNPNYSQADTLDFHERAGEGNIEESVFMKRSYVETVSITSIYKQKEAAKWFYHDVKTDSFYQDYFELD